MNNKKLLTPIDESKQIALSSSDGTQLTVQQINHATKLLRDALQRLTEINEGTYRQSQKPIVFDADTSQELLDSVYYAFHEAQKLCDFILYHE